MYDVCRMNLSAAFSPPPYVKLPEYNYLQVFFISFNLMNLCIFSLLPKYMIMQTEVVGREFKKHFVRGLRDIEKLDLLCEVPICYFHVSGAVVVSVVYNVIEWYNYIYFR